MSGGTYTGFGDVKFSGDEHSTAAFVFEQMRNSMATATLVQVKAVSGSTVNVQPMVHQIDGAGTALPHGIIHGLPWFALRAGGCEVRATPVVGDIGLAVFCHSDISSVKANAAPALPGSRRRYDWSDGVYFGGFLAQGAAETFIDVAPGAIEIKAATIKLTGDVQVTGSIEATGDTTSNGKSLDSHTHGGVATGSGNTGPPA